MHPSQMPEAGRSVLSYPVTAVWPGSGAEPHGLASRQDAQLYRSLMWAEFRLVIEQVLGADRGHLALGDEEAFPLIMDVLWNGKTHAEAAEGICLADDLAERHREYAESGVLATFLLRYPELHYRVSALIQESSVAAERS